MKQISSPVIASDLRVEDNSVFITLTANTGVPSYIIRGYYMTIGNEAH